MSQGNRHRTVFARNISYEGTEEELRTLFSSVGSIVSLRLITDRETGKRRGYGFIEYLDVETALSAVRNLNDIEFHGRPLQVNSAEQDTRNASETSLPSKKRKVGAPDSAAAGAGVGAGAGMARTGDPGCEISAGADLEPVDPLSNVIEKYGRAELFGAMCDAKKLLASRPVETENFFSSQVNACVAWFA